ncbi:hypothetical protein C1J03_15460 [Sulfitobacter sp. SK012]|nr:hypothetical protein C1J03_15460 [Sulfitobacter sp. SK012]
MEAIKEGEKQLIKDMGCERRISAHTSEAVLVPDFWFAGVENRITKNSCLPASDMSDVGATMGLKRDFRGWNNGAVLDN